MAMENNDQQNQSPEQQPTHNRVEVERVTFTDRKGNTRIREVPYYTRSPKLEETFERQRLGKYYDIVQFPKATSQQDVQLFIVPSRFEYIVDQVISARLHAT